MKTINKYIIAAVFAALSAFSATAQQNDEMKYRRNSIYSVLIAHNEQDFCEEIREQFSNIPVPDKYNDHNLNIRCLNISDKGKYTDDITNYFVNGNNIGSRLVARWFNRNILTGECNLDLVKERGLYNASAFDAELAKRSARGIAMLEDAGEDLIGNTFLIVNEVSYIDKNIKAKRWGIALSIIGGLAGAATGNSDYADLGSSYGQIISTLKGFSVKIHTRLYKLVWDEATANMFYTQFYSDKPDEAKRKAFEENRDKFKMKYIGDVESKGSNTSFLGINEDEPYLMIRKACQRAIDENVADLQKRYEQFRVKAPIVSVEPTITVQIGLKEGIDKDSRFEVLEAVDNNGKIEYKRVGVIRPVESRIWDNRFMASEEQAYGAEFGATTFVKESGDDFYPGMLVREID